MIIYFSLIAFILLCPFFTSIFSFSESKRRKISVVLSTLAIYLVCALKSTSVGIDIPGYKMAYNQAGSYDWFDTSYIYYEAGYILLEKLFNFLNFSFQEYMIVVYAIIFIPIGIFIYRYSKNVTMSFIVYVCYQTLVFNLSGIRQSIAMSICLGAYMVLGKKNIKNDLVFFILVALATQIHRSAILFLLAYVAKRVKLNLAFIGSIIVAFASAFLFRGNIVSIINMYTGKYQATESMTLGGNFLFLLGTLFVLAFLYFKNQLNMQNYYNLVLNKTVFLERQEFAEGTIKMLAFAVILQLVLNGSSALRAANYFSMFMILAIPDIEGYFDSKSQKIYFLIITLFMIILFYTQSLAINQFNCVPYTFFWQ